MMKTFKCPYCGKTLENQSHWIIDYKNKNEFYCDDCNKTYLVDEDKNNFREEAS